MSQVKKSKSLHNPRPVGVPKEIAVMRSVIKTFFDQTTEDGFKLRHYYGAYVFFDFEKEPIYVGQSIEGLGARVGRHLTNQRTDAVAMNVLDPLEVAFIEVFPLFHKDCKIFDKKEMQLRLDALEYTIYKKVLTESSLGAVLNEKDLRPCDLVPIPPSFRSQIIPDELLATKSHPDLRIARRATTIARLAQVISERDVSARLRRTLVTQARRLEKLSSERFESFANRVPIKTSED